MQSRMGNEEKLSIGRYVALAQLLEHNRRMISVPSIN